MFSAFARLMLLGLLAGGCSPADEGTSHTVSGLYIGQSAAQLSAFSWSKEWNNEDADGLGELICLPEEHALASPRSGYY
ncbi:hypothetical protein BH23GEM5_BH23GEM5_08250 [soil metagenome]